MLIKQQFKGLKSLTVFSYQFQVFMLKVVLAPIVKYFPAISTKDIPQVITSIIVSDDLRESQWKIYSEPMGQVMYGECYM